LGGIELHDAELERQATVHDAHHPHQLGEAMRAVDDQRLIALAQSQRLQHPRQAEPVVGVEMRDEHAVHVDQSHRAQQLTLGAFTAVEQEPVAAATHEDGGQSPAGSRSRAACAGEEQRQVHGL